MNRHGYDIGEQGRLLACLLMIGTVAELDEANARVTLDVDGLRTHWLPWIVRRAGPDAEWWAPEPGEQVLVACPYGDTTQGVVVGSIYQQAFPAPANVKTVRAVTFADGTRVEYDRASHTLTVDTVQSQGIVNVICKQAAVTAQDSVEVDCKTATVKASVSVTLDTPNTHCTGNLAVDGSMTVTGESTMQGNVTVNGSTSVKAITSNGTNISSTHKHPGDSGGMTGPPQ